MESYGGKFEPTVMLKSESEQNSHMFVSHKEKQKCNLRIVSAIIMIYEPLAIKLAKNIVFNYFSQYQTAKNFATVSKLPFTFTQVCWGHPSAGWRPSPRGSRRRTSSTGRRLAPIASLGR